MILGSIDLWSGRLSQSWILGVSFVGMAIWTLIPDKIEEEETQIAKHLGVFGATFITFFLAEMGDKTEVPSVFRLPKG